MSTDAYAISITKPLPITDAMLISTNIAENDYAAWSAATTYAIGQRVILTSTHKIYESLQNTNLNNDPTTSPTWWIEVSATNRWKCFDSSNSTRTVASGAAPTTITYTLRPGQAITSIGILNVINATQLTIQMTDPVYGAVYSRTVDFNYLPLQSSWWAWFFGQKTQITQYVAIDVPSFPNADVIITLTGIAALGVGVILIGQQQRYGLGIKYGARVGIQDYSRKETNDFGDTTLVVRAFAKRANFELLLDAAEVDQLQTYLASIRATPVLWVGSSSYESTAIFGFYKDFDILINYPTHSDCELQIEGLT